MFTFEPSPLMLHLALRGVEIVALVLFVIALILAFKNIRSEEEFEPKEALREVGIAVAAFFFFLFFSGQSISLFDSLAAIGAGLAIGFIVSGFVPLYRTNSHWFTRGSLIFMILWSLVILGSKITERIMGDVNYWWLINGIVAISMIVGNVLNLLVRKKWFKL